MSTSAATSSPYHEELAQLLATQRGLLSRSQAGQHGITDDYVRASLAARRWQRIHPGIYATFTGGLTFEQKVWAALLYCGPGAIASHRTAALLDRLAEPLAGPEPEAETICVTIPGARRVAPQPGIRIYHRDRAERVRHPARLPPRTRIEETVLDLWEQAARLDDGLATVTRACQRRLTTAKLLEEAAARRKKLRRRTLLGAVLADVVAGAESLLELIYLRNVERAHGLPTGIRNVAVRRGDRTQVADVDYPDYATTVETDGRVGHGEEGRWRDMRRDNRTTMAGRVTLRYGWTDLTDEPCAVAAQVARVLSSRGWNGRPRTCGPHCRLRFGAPVIQ